MGETPKPLTGLPVPSGGKPAFRTGLTALPHQNSTDFYPTDRMCAWKNAQVVAIPPNR